MNTISGRTKIELAHTSAQNGVNKEHELIKLYRSKGPQTLEFEAELSSMLEKTHSYCNTVRNSKSYNQDIIYLLNCIHSSLKATENELHSLS